MEARKHEFMIEPLNVSYEAQLACRRPDRRSDYRALT
jgi:hypothetical protein